MKLIVEGVDLSGKTYAIERIGKNFNSGFILKNTYKPRSSEDSHKIYTQYWHILSLIQKAKGIVILDRFFPSQAVYSYKRGVDEFGSEEIQELDDFCTGHDFVYIYLDTPINILLSRFDSDGDEYIKKAELRKLKGRYDEFWEMTKMNKIRVNTLEEGWLDKLNMDLLPFIKLVKEQ